MRNNWLIGGVIGLSLLLPVLAHAAGSADLSIDAGSITFSTTKFYAGDVVRIYARVRNLGDVDMQGSVVFYNSSKIVGATQPVSLRVGGAPEEVFVDFLLPEGSFNIYAVIAGSSPADENSSNDSAMTPLYSVIVDADKDGVLDESDNCRDVANADQADLDHDNIGDRCDSVDNTPKPVAVVAPAPVVAPTPAPVVAPVTTVVTVKQPVSNSVSTTLTQPKANSIAQAEDDGGSVVAPSVDDGVLWPNKAYGIFDNVLAADPVVAATATSFWRLTNPAVQILLIVLGLLAIGCLLSVIVVRRRARRDMVTESIEAVTEAESEL